MAYRVASFEHEGDYQGWLRHAGDSIRIVDTSVTRRNWSAGAGFFTRAQTYTVTYEVVGAGEPDPNDYTMFRDRARTRALVGGIVAILIACAVFAIASV